MVRCLNTLLFAIRIWVRSLETNTCNTWANVRKRNRHHLGYYDLVGQRHVLVIRRLEAGHLGEVSGSLSAWLKVV